MVTCTGSSMALVSIVRLHPRDHRGRRKLQRREHRVRNWGTVLGERVLSHLFFRQAKSKWKKKDRADPPEKEQGRERREEDTFREE